jgi:hypothetical protein
MDSRHGHTGASPLHTVFDRHQGSEGVLRDYLFADQT